MILFENEFFIVIDKPHGMSVHNETPSVAEWLKSNNKPLHFVNRLDSQTSGLMLVAQKPELHQKLASSLDAGTKKYRALLRGAFKSSKPEFTWDQPMSDKAEGIKNPHGIKKDLVEALTLGTVEIENKYFTEVTCIIKTGRQHQIRKHSSLNKNPIVGDPRYNEKKYNSLIFEKYKINRMFLHAEYIQFDFNQETYKFESLEFKNTLGRFFK